MNLPLLNDPGEVSGIRARRFRWADGASSTSSRAPSSSSRRRHRLSSRARRCSWMEGGPRSRSVARPLSFVSTALIRDNHRHAQHIVPVNGRRNMPAASRLDVVLCPVSTVSWMPIVRACLPPAVAHRPDPPACRASEVDEAAGWCNGDGGQPMTIFAGRLCADDRRVHIGRSSTLSSRSAYPGRCHGRHAPGSSPVAVRLPFVSECMVALVDLRLRAVVAAAGGDSEIVLRKSRIYLTLPQGDRQIKVRERRERFSVSLDPPSRAGGGSGRQRAST